MIAGKLEEERTMMGQPPVREEPELLEGVRARVRAHFELGDGELTPEADRLMRFIDQYYRWVPADDLKARPTEDLFGAALAHWRLAQRREPGERRLRVTNPDPDADGWTSPHTVLEIVTDDMPFLVDSIDMELSRLGYDPHLVIHPMIRLSRDRESMINAIHDPGSDAGVRESFIHVEFDREEDPARREAVTTAIGRVLDDVAAAVRDWQAMRERALLIAAEMSEAAPEAAAFLRWLTEDHFTFLGYREYDFSPAGGDAPARLSVRDGSGLGILAHPPERPVTPLGPQAAAIALAREPLVLTKANARATVHRPAHLDYVGIKEYDAAGAVTGERRFLGLYTTTAYRENAADIPLIRGPPSRRALSDHR
jgi:glutamate dehydrogenase